MSARTDPQRARELARDEAKRRANARRIENARPRTVPEIRRTLDDAATQLGYFARRHGREDADFLRLLACKLAQWLTEAPSTKEEVAGKVEWLAQHEARSESHLMFTRRLAERRRAREAAERDTKPQNVVDFGAARAGIEAKRRAARREEA